MPRKFRLRELPDGVLLVALDNLRYEKAAILTKANKDWEDDPISKKNKKYLLTVKGMRKVKEQLDVRQ